MQVRETRTSVEEENKIKQMRKLSVIKKYLRGLGLIAFLSYLFQRLIKRNKILRIKVPSLRDEVLIRNNPNDIQVFTQIFINHEYNIVINEEVKTIIDCGANIGLASLFFLSKFPEAKIIAVEPEGNNFHMLRQNMGNHKNVICINKGIWSKTTSLEITNFSRGEAGFIINESQSASDSTIQAISIDELINEFELKEIDILKIDIEGSEEQVFLEEPKWIKKVNIVFCEIHENMKPGLTARIKSMLMPYFNCFVHGEYHVFEKKINAQQLT